MKNDKAGRCHVPEQTEGPPRKRGRPPIIGTPAEMDRLVDEYVALKVEAKAPITLMGMILHLGLSSRESLDGYADRPGFADSVKKAKAIIAETYERRLHGPQPAGAIFALKNMGWSDRLDVSSQSVSANIDFGRLSDDQIRRIASGEAVGSVLSSIVADHARQLTAGASDEGKMSAAISKA